LEKLKAEVFGAGVLDAMAKKSGVIKRLRKLDGAALSHQSSVILVLKQTLQFV